MLSSISSYLRISAERYADSIAVSDGKSSLLYRDLLVNAEKIADVFVKKSIFKKTIAVMIEKSCYVWQLLFCDRRKNAAEPN